PPPRCTSGAILKAGRRSMRELHASDKAAVELPEYFDALLPRRRADPRDDLVSALAFLDDQLTDVELIANLITLFNAGFVTTTHLLGNGLTLLLDNRNVDPAPFVEEVLRFEPPVH